MSTISPARLEDAILRRLTPVVPAGVRLSGGLIEPLLESWDLDSEWEEALEFVVRRFLEEQQEEVILEIHEGWPTPSGALAMPEVLVLVDDRVLRLSFQSDGDVTLTLPDIPFQEFM